MTPSNYIWSKDDDLIGYCFYRFEGRESGLSMPELAAVLGMGLESMTDKINHYQALNGIGDFDEFSDQEISVYEAHERMTDMEVLDATVLALERTRARLSDTKE